MRRGKEEKEEKAEARRTTTRRGGSKRKKNRRKTKSNTDRKPQSAEERASNPICATSKLVKGDPPCLGSPFFKSTASPDSPPPCLGSGAPRRRRPYPGRPARRRGPSWPSVARRVASRSGAGCLFALCSYSVHRSVCVYI